MNKTIRCHSMVTLQRHLRRKSRALTISRRPRRRPTEAAVATNQILQREPYGDEATLITFMMSTAAGAATVLTFIGIRWWDGEAGVGYMCRTWLDMAGTMMFCCFFLVFDRNAQRTASGSFVVFQKYTDFLSSLPMFVPVAYNIPSWRGALFRSTLTMSSPCSLVDPSYHKHFLSGFRNVVLDGPGRRF